MFQTDLFNPTPHPTHGNHYIEPRGYIGRPGSGPAGKTCRSCEYRLVIRVGNRTVPKCEKYRKMWTHSRRTDILISTPACQYYMDRM